MIASEEIRKKRELRAFTALSLLILSAIVIALVFSGKLAIIGLQILGISNETQYTQDFANTITSSQTLTLELAEHPAGFNLRSLRLDGSIIGGNAKAHLVTEEKNYLIFDSERIDIEKNRITGRQVADDISENDSATETAPDDGFANTTENSTSTEIIENGGFALNDTENVPAEQTEQEQQTLPEKRIEIKLSYQRGTRWDANDDGIAFTEADAVDFNVAETSFSWDADNAKLCTKWTITSDETGSSTTLCNGAADCCMLAGVAPKEESWNAPLYLYYEQYGSTMQNTVSAQVLFLDQSLAEGETRFDSVQSEAQTVSAGFEQGYEILFSGECEETCLLPEGINSTEYTIIFELEQGTILKTTKAAYTLEALASNATITISPDIKDSKGRPVKAKVTFTESNTKRKAAEHESGSAAKGQRASIDAGTYDLGIAFAEAGSPVKSIEIHDTKLASSSESFLRFEDLEETGELAQYKEVYAIDPTALNFSYATVTGIAEGNTLLKCKDWDFTAQKCYGTWTPVMSIAPGQEYTFTLTPEDPAYAQLTIANCAGENASLNPDTFNVICRYTYPGNALFLDDLLNETFQVRKQGGTGYWGGIRINSTNTSVTNCQNITSVMLCHKWWPTTTQIVNCNTSVDSNGGASWTAINTTCPTAATEPTAITCNNVTLNESWNCSHFFGNNGALAKIELQSSATAAPGYYDIIWDALYFNVTYNSTAANATAPPGQTTELGNQTTIVWNITGISGQYWVYRNGTLFQGPGNWTGGIPLITLPNVYFLGQWNYTLVFNELGGPNSSTTTTVTVVDNIMPNCSSFSGSTAAPAKATITVDGNMSEWAPILANPYNYVTDLSLAQGDNDAISTTDRDMVKFAYTYNDQYLYFYFQRMIRGSRQVSMLVYIDYNLDGYMNSTDKVVKFVWGGSNALYDADIYSYVPANASGDLMQGSGYDMPGYITGGVQLEAQVLGGAYNGVELETRVSWSQLGLPGPTPLLFKGASAMGAGTNLPSQLEDNVGSPLSASSAFVVFQQSQEKPATNGTSVYYTFEMLNCGNRQETIDLTNISSQNWSMTLYYSNGTQITDTNSNGLLDILLGMSGYSAVILKLDVPSNATYGTTDITNLTAISGSNNASVTTKTTVASIAIAPKTTVLSGAAGMTVSVNYTVYNYQSIQDTININATSSQGWQLLFRYTNGTQLTDTNGDGRIDVGKLLAQQSIGVVLYMTISPTNATGTADTTIVRINSSATPALTDTAAVSTTVSDRLILVKSYNSTVSVNNVYYYQLNITNNWNTTEPIEITKISNLGWTTTFLSSDLVTPLSDTNSNGKPDITVPAYGGKKTFYAAITVPANATMGVSEITDVFANSSSNSSVYRTIRINETPRGIVFFNDSSRNNIDYSFFVNDTVYARGYYLQGITTVYMVWYDGIAARRTSPNITVTAQGTADDSIATNESFDTGMWTVIIFNADDGTEATRGSFDLVDPIIPSLVAWKPPQNYTAYTSTTIEIAANATDNIGVYLVYANITYPNGTYYWLELYNSTNITWNSTFLIPNLTGQYNVTFIARDVYGNVNNTATTYFIVYDNIPPSVTELKPTAGSQYNYSTTIEIAANVTDNIAVSTVYANITYPNGTVQTIPLTNAGGAKYNSSFVTPTLPGAYTVLIFANDTSGNINATQTTTFTVLAPAPTYPMLYLNSPPDGYSTYNTTVTFNWTANSSQYGTMLCNLTIDGSVNASNILVYNSTPKTYTVNNLTASTHYWNVSCWGDISLVNRSETRNFTITEYPMTLLAFSLTLPGQPAVNASAEGNRTADMNFTSNQSTYYGMEPCVGATADCQNSTLPFFRYLNTGSVNLTLNLSMNASLPPTLRLSVNTAHNNATANTVNTSPLTLGTNILPGAYLDAWFFGDFIDAYPNQSTYRNLTSTGGQS